jgi:hypothetical protein
VFGSVNAHVTELVPVPFPVIWTVSPPAPLQVGFGPEGAVIVHTTAPVGWGSVLIAGLAPMVALNVRVEPGWAGVGDALPATAVDDFAACTVMLAVPLPWP